MELGVFSISLAVKDLEASRSFYEKFGFKVFAGDASQNWLIVKNGDRAIGLFQGMFDKNILTFNPLSTGDAGGAPAPQLRPHDDLVVSPRGRAIRQTFQVSARPAESDTSSVVPGLSPAREEDATIDRPPPRCSMLGTTGCCSRRVI